MVIPCTVMRILYQPGLIISDIDIGSLLDMDHASLAISDGSKNSYTGDNWVSRMLMTFN